MDTLENFGNTILLKDRVYNVLKTEIVLGHLKPGQRLNILDLSNKMNISSAPVREALNMLSKDGLVDLLPHKQAVVSSGNSDDWAICIDLREMLEPYAAKISVHKIPQEKIDEIRKQLKSVLEKPDDMTAYIESDIALHDIMYAYAQSKLLSETLTNLKLYTIRIRYSPERFYDNNPSDQKSIIIKSTTEHLNILDALESRDPDRVYTTVLQHIQKYAERNKVDAATST